MQQRNRAAIGTLIFFVVAPGTVAGLMPYWLTDAGETLPPIGICECRERS